MRDLSHLPEFEPQTTTISKDWFYNTGRLLGYSIEELDKWWEHLNNQCREYSDEQSKSTD